MLSTQCWTLRGAGTDPIKGDVYLTLETAKAAQSVLESQGLSLGITMAKHRLVLAFGVTDQTVSSEALLQALGGEAPEPAPDASKEVLGLGFIEAMWTCGTRLDDLFRLPWLPQGYRRLQRPPRQGQDDNAT